MLVMMVVKPMVMIAVMMLVMMPVMALVMTVIMITLTWPEDRDTHYTLIQDFNQLFTCEYMMKNVLSVTSLPSKLTAI